MRLTEKTVDKESKKFSNVGLILYASVALILTVAILLSVIFLLFGRDEPSAKKTAEDNSSYSKVIPINKISYPSGKPLYYGSPSTAGSVNLGSPNTSGISVTAELIEELPGVYILFDDWRQINYKLLKMRTVKVLGSGEMVDEFYYMLPIDYDSDFSKYHSFVIADMAQHGFEDHVIYNMTTGENERLSLVLFGAYFKHYISFEQFIAFDEYGTLDRSLWLSNEKWRESEEYILDECWSNYSLEQAEREIAQTNDLSVNLLKDAPDIVLESLDYVHSIENGLFVPSTGNKLYSVPDTQVSYVRYINGFATNEIVHIFGEDVTYSKAKITAEEENKLPDLASAMATLNEYCEAGEIYSPHFVYDSDKAKRFHAIKGWYADTAWGALGVIRIDWHFIQDGQSYYDDMYYLVIGGFDYCIPVKRDVLLQMLGTYEKSSIFTGDYDENGKVLGPFAY